MGPAISVFLLVVLFLGSGSQAAVSIGVKYHPDHPGHCYIEGVEVMSLGQSITHPKRCEEILCLYNSAVMRRTCPGVLKPGSMRPTGRIKYPYCCS